MKQGKRLTAVLTAACLCLLGMPGDPALVSGICVELDSEDFGKFGGKYLIDSSTHTVSSGYTTDLEMHRVEG